MSNTFETENGVHVPSNVVNEYMTTNESVRSARESLSAMLGKSFGGDRDYYEQFGYKDPEEVDIDTYWDLYARYDIATRIVEAPADTCWKDNPDIVAQDDSGDELEDTEFENEWEKLNDKLSIYSKMERADRLSGVGRFGLLLIGVKGDDNLDQPLESVDSSEDIIYLSPYSERSIDNIDVVDNPGNKRFGLPEYYDIDLNGSLSGSDPDRVHHTRVIHIAEHLNEDEVYGTPRLRNVLNRFEDLRKIVGGSAEMFWQAAERGLNINAKEGADLDLDDMREKAEDYIHELSRILPTKNMDVKELGGDVKEPNSIFDNILSLIAGAKKIPKRELLGSERGDLASQQDQYNWNGRMEKRRVQHVSPIIIRPTVDKFQDIGALPEQNYKVEWPNLFTHTAEEKANIRKANAQALKTAGEAAVSGIARDSEIRKRVDLPKEKPEPEANESLDEEDEEVKKQFEEGKKLSNMSEEEIQDKIDGVLEGF